MGVTTSCRDLRKLQPLAKQACELLLARAKEEGLVPLITETLRTQERQNYLYCQGRTVAQATSAGIAKDFATKYCKPSAAKVTLTLNSNHMTGYAWVIC